MLCSNCGKEAPDKAKFCISCGAKTAVLDRQAESSPNEQEAKFPSIVCNVNSSETEALSIDKLPTAETTAAAKINEATGDLKNSLKKPNKAMKCGIIGGCIAVVALAIIAAIVILILPTFASVPTDTARQAFAQNSFATKGAVSSNYTNPSSYEVKDFKIDGQEDASASSNSNYRQTTRTSFGGNQAKTVYFSGTIANDSFETSFTGQCDFVNANGSWSQASSSSLKINTTSTKPLKGVDALDQKTESDNISYSDFNSDLKESNGVYSSNATSTITYKYWFANDTAKVSQAFTFDPSSGWKASGDAIATDQSTQWNLKDRTFEYSGNTGLFMNGTIGSSITFGEVNDGNASASYTLDYTPSAGMGDSYTTYHSISLKGTATGKPSHEFGTSNFTIQLSDSGQSVDIACESSFFTSYANTKNAFDVTMDTKTPYATYKGGSRESYLAISSCAFTETTQTNA